MNYCVVFCGIIMDDCGEEKEEYLGTTFFGGEDSLEKAKEYCYSHKQVSELALEPDEDWYEYYDEDGEDDSINRKIDFSDDRGPLLTFYIHAINTR